MQSDTTVTPTSTALAVDIRRFPWIRRFAADYAFAFDRVRDFFAGNPADSGAWADAIKRRHAHTGSPADTARVLADQQARREAPAASRDAAARLADPRTVVIITGQQAGLFGGPLFTLLKAITAMKLAARVSREHGVPVVPVFWIDAEDHDWAEVQSCTILDGSSVPTPIRLADLPGAGDLSIGRLVLDSQVDRTIAAFDAALPDSAFKGDLLNAVRAAYRPGRTMAEAFGRLLETTLGPYGLVVYDSSDPAAKALAQPVFVRELSAPGETARLAGERGQALVAAGYHAQVTPSGGAVSLFYLNSGREAIRVVGDRVRLGDRETSLTDLREDVQRSPQHFSPNVLLRPVVQDTIFPTICYVAGPNELAYLGQLRDVYAAFQVPMPLMYQRATATLVDSSTLRFLTKYDVPIEALQPQDEAALNQLLQDQLPPTVEQALTDAAAAVESQMVKVAEAVPQIDPTLSGTVNSTLTRMQHDLRTLQNKVIQAAKRRDETLRRQFQHAQTLTFPNGHPQERELGFIWFTNHYGPALVDRLLEELPLDMGHHWVLTV